MIKVELVIDGDTILINGKEVHIFAEYGYEAYTYVDDLEFEVLEEAIAYCLENK